MLSPVRFFMQMSLLASLPSAAIAADNGKAARTDLYGDLLPPGAVARLGSTRFRFAQPIGSLAFSPDGKRLAGSSYRDITIWDVATGKRIREFKFDSVYVRLVGFTADGKVLAVGTENFSRRSGTEAEHVVLLRPEVEPEPIRMPVLASRPSQLALSPDGKRLLLFDVSSIDVWDLATREKVRTIAIDWQNAPAERRRLFGSFISDMALSVDHRTAATIDFQTEAIHLVDLGTEKTIRQWSGAPSGKRTRHLTFSPDGKTLITGGDNGIRVWDTASGKELRRLAEKGPFPSAFAVSLDGKTIATVAEEQKVIMLWDTATGRRTTPAGMEAGSLTALNYTDAKTLMTLDDQKTVSFWDAASGKCLRRLTADPSFSRILAVSAGGKLLAGVSDEDRVGVWDTVTGKTRWQSTMPLVGLTRLSFAPDGKTLRGVAGGKVAPYLIVWDAVTGKGADKIALPLSGESLLFWADGIIVGIATEGPRRGEFHLFRLGRGRKWRSLGAPIQLPKGSDPYALSPDGRTLLVKTKDSHPLYREQKLGLVETISGGFAGWLRSTTEVVGSPVREAAFSPNGKWIASTHLDGSIHLWDVAARREVERFTADEGESKQIAFSPDGQTFASARLDQTVLIWQARPLFDLDGLWHDLAGANVEAAQRAIGKLVASPRQSVAYVEKRLRPLPKGDGRRLRKLLAGLDSDSFTDRQEAQQELEKEGEAAEDALQEAVANKPSLELRRRVNDLLERLEERRRELSPEDVRIIRAVQVLEAIGSAQARQALHELSEGASGALRTREARAALRRLESKTVIKTH